MRIEVDPAKRAATLEHRGLDFANAAEVFEEPHTIEPDERFDYGEDRFITAGSSSWSGHGATRHAASSR